MTDFRTFRTVKRMYEKGKVIDLGKNTSLALENWLMGSSVKLLQDKIIVKMMMMRMTVCFFKEMLVPEVSNATS